MNATQLNLLDRPWCEDISRAIAANWAGKEFTSDDIHAVFSVPAHRNWFGVVTAAMKNRGLIECVGYRPSKRKQANGRVIAVWRVKS